MNPLAPNASLLHFRIIEKIGQGGMGVVYKAKDLKLGRVVAIKVLPAAKSDSEKARLRFLQEARSASALNHPNIVTIHSIETIDEADFIVMEFVEGKRLTELIGRSPLEISVLLDIGIQIADALGCAHAAGIIHRDIKTENILVTERGQVKVLDFGLAKVWLSGSAGEPDDLETMAQITEAGTMLGTAHYMSPEQARGESLDPRTDVFSLGCVLYQCATARLPFLGNTLPAVLLQIATSEPALPSSVRDDLPAGFDEIIRTALAKNRDARYASGAEVGEALKQLLISLSMPASGVDRAEQLRVSSFRLVGRDDDYQRLLTSLHAALNGEGKIVFLLGEPGIGKSALAEEFLRSTSRSIGEVAIARGRCVEQYGTAQAYLPFTDAVGSMLSGSSRERLTAILRAHAPTWHAQFPVAFASTGALEKSLTESIGATKDRMLREMAEALFAFAATTPLVILLEDLHWADPSSVDLLRYIAQRMNGKKLMVLGTLRPADAELNNPAMRSCLAEVRSHNLADELTLGALNKEAIQNYLDASFSPNNFSNDLPSLLYSKTEGQPLFVTSLLQYLVAQNDIRKEGEIWSLTRPAQEMKMEVPENVSSMIRKKIDVLPEEDRRALQYASIAGEEFTSTLLAELLDADEIQLEEQLHRIQKSHRLIAVVGEEELPDRTLTTKYRFTHALYKNALDSDIVTKRRILLHRKAGESLLRHHANRAAEIANRLGEHFSLGRDFQRAVRYLGIAGDNAAALHANEEAIALYGKALQQVAQFTSEELNQEWKQVARELQEKLGDALALNGQQENAREQLNRSFTESTSPIDSARVKRKIAKAFETERKFPEALDGYKEAERMLEEFRSDSASWWQEWLQIGLDRQWLHYTQNQISELDGLIQKLEPHLMGHASANQRARFFFGVVLAGYRKDRYFITDKNLEYCRRFLSAAEESGNLYEVGGASFALGFAQMWKGNFAAASNHIVRALQLAEKLGDRILESRSRTYLSVLHRKQQDLQRASESNVQAMELAKSINMKEYVATGYANLAWLAFKRSRLEEVVENGEKALEIWAGLTLVYPFQNLALWPLIAADLAQQRYADAFNHARLLLRPDQQKFSDSLTDAITRSIENESVDALREALHIAGE